MEFLGPILESWRPDWGTMGDQLVSGIDRFGPYADWLWAMPILWVSATILIWVYTARQRRRADLAYLAYASRQLPVLRRIARQRAQEVAFSRRTDRF